MTVISDTSLVFKAIFRDSGVASGLTKTANDLSFFSKLVSNKMFLIGSAAALVTPDLLALGQSVVHASGAFAILPAALSAAVLMAIAAKVAFSGLGDAWKATGAAANAGGTAAADVAHKVELAHRSVRDATQSLVDAQREATAAQLAVTRAREDATLKLEDLSRALRGARLDERGAVLAVADAMKRLRAARDSGDASAVKHEQLAYEQSVLTLEEVRAHVTSLTKEKTIADAKGVEGSDQVKSALLNQEQTQRALVAATEHLADAQRELALATKGVGTAAYNAALALAKLAPAAAVLVTTMRALAPAWTAAGKAAQQATFSGVADEVRQLSTVYLPSMTLWLAKMGGAFNEAIRSTLQLTTTAKYARDVDSTLGNVANTTMLLAQSLRPAINGLNQFVTIGATFLPGLAMTVRDVAHRFEAWAIAARETGRMHEWIATGLSTLGQFWQLTKNLVMSVAALFKAGENHATLDSLVAATGAMRAWLESAQGQQKVADLLGHLRDLFHSLISIVGAVASEGGGLADVFSVTVVVAGFLADHLETFKAVLPTLIDLYIAWKVVQLANNVVTLAGAAATAINTAKTLAQGVAIKALTFAQTSGSAVARLFAASTIGATAATAAGDAATKRSIASMLASKVAMAASAVATGYMTVTQWLFNTSLYGCPLVWIVVAVLAFIAVIILVIKYHKEIAAWVVEAWDKIWTKVKEFGLWLWNDLAPMVFNALTWPYRMAWEGIKWVWQMIQDGATFAVDWVVGKFLTFLGFVTSLPGKMRSAAAGLWDTLKDSFREALNWLIRKWNAFSLTLGGGTVLGVSIPSVTLNTPDLPYLDTGGDISKTGLAVVHQGERVLTAAQVDSSSRGGETRVVHELRSDGSELSDWIVGLLRKAVRNSSGGTVEFVITGK